MNVTAATVKPCPVAWCDDAGHHVYDWGRICRHETGQALPGLDIGAEVYENDEGELTPPVVEIGGPGAGSLELTSREQVDAFVAAVLRAAAVAFPVSVTLKSVGL